MSIVMFALSAFAVVIGVVLVAAGIPVKEFGFGNALIVAGSVAMVGGLIVFSLAVVLGQLQRIADMLGARPATRTARPFEAFEASPGRLGQGPGQIPFPTRPKSAASEPHDDAEPVAAASAVEDRAPEPPEPDAMPVLPNPEETAFEPDEAPLMPRQIPPLRPGQDTERSNPPGGGWRPATPPLRAPQPNYFDAMWPAEPPGGKPAGEPPSVRPEPPLRETFMRETVARETAEPKRPEPAQPAPPPEPAKEVRAVPVLKSGVIDGMGYTLYVDGSIEAELPHGTLHFASIGELREHLEKSV